MANTPAEVSLHSLPDSLLASTLSNLSLTERHRSPVLVCRRWHQLLHTTPQLLSSIDVAFGEGQRGADRLQAFSAWLLQHALPHIRRLNLEVGDMPDAQASRQVVARIVAALVGCGLAGKLEGLRLEGPPCQPALWTGTQPSLRRLIVEANEDVWEEEGDLDWRMSPKGLPLLEELVLTGLVSAPAGLALPTGLTKLHLSSFKAQPFLPQQLAPLTRLHSLSLAELTCPSAGYAGLAQLPGLRRLGLRSCQFWPACLSALTGLEALALVDDADSSNRVQSGADESGTDILAAACPRLQRLTLLALDSVQGTPVIPSAVTSLHGLHSFYWFEYSGGTLPAGEWLRSLRRLTAFAESLAASLPALERHATSLEVAGAYFYDTKQADATHLAAALGSAPRLPALRRLLLRADEELFAQQLRGLLAAQRARPDMLVDCVHWTGYERFAAECGYCFFPEAHKTFRDEFLEAE
ncbi:hypothetical protein ABPG75_009664 [Micractinium tetrahymenae]